MRLERLKSGFLRGALVTIVAVAVFSFFFTSAAYAVNSVTRLPGVIDRPPVYLPKDVKKKAKPGKKAVKEDVKAGGPTVTIRKVEFSGDLIFKEVKLQAIAKPFLNRPITKRDIADLKYKLTKRYYKSGYVLVRVTTPPQKLASGVLKIAIGAGKVGNVSVKGRAVRGHIVRSHFTNRIKRGKYFNEHTVEGAVKNLDDIGGVEAKLSLKPGGAYGTTDLLLTTDKERETIASVSVDNYGSELTGKYVLTASLRKSNLLRMGESLGFTYRRSDKDMQTFMGDVSIPIGLMNIRLEGNYLYSENDIEGSLTALNMEGKTQRGGVALSGKIRNSSKRMIAWRVGGEHRLHESFLDAMLETRDKISQVYVQASYLTRHKYYSFYLDLKATKGIDALDSNSVADPDASRVMGDPMALRFNGRAFSSIGFTRNNHLTLDLQWQIASNELLASDMFSIGGYGSVRGFDVAFASSDAGVQFNAELLHTFILTPSGKHRFYFGPFYDAGSVYDRIRGNRIPPGMAALNPDDKIYSAGLGAELVMKLIPGANTVVRADWAHPLRRHIYEDQTTIAANTFYFKFSQSY
ncbi:MAG: ShlB/FhaC/HecB family hemolysin secretion/activation protein [Thermodesulfobacteriota bacterium]